MVIATVLASTILVKLPWADGGHVVRLDLVRRIQRVAAHFAACYGPLQSERTLRQVDEDLLASES